MMKINLNYYCKNILTGTPIESDRIIENEIGKIRPLVWLKTVTE